MMYSKRKTLHYITKEMQFLYNFFVASRFLPLILKDNKLIYRMVLKNRGKKKFTYPILLLSCLNGLLCTKVVEM